MNKHEQTVYSRELYTRDQVTMITGAYKRIFGPIGAELREYWDLDRKRDWGCLTTDFHNATFEQYERASRRAIEIEATILDPMERGKALRKVTKDERVGLSLGVCPWTDHGLFQTYEENKHNSQLTIILGQDWYPIVPEGRKPHPVDVPLCRRIVGREDLAGLLVSKKYIRVGAVPAKIMEGKELLLFLNFKPDFRPPNTPVTGRFDPYPRCTEGFNALIEAVSRNFKVQVISWGAPVWKVLRDQVVGMKERLGVCQNAKKNAGSLLELQCGRQLTVPYLPLAHPCDPRNFNRDHAKHAYEGFLKMGLGGCAVPS